MQGWTVTPPKKTRLWETSHHRVWDGGYWAEGMREGSHMTVKVDTTQTTPMLVCSSCGKAAAGDDQAARLTWSRSVERGRTTWTCQRCSRDHLRSIETKLDPEWW